MNKYPPCYRDCEGRSENCHSICEAYKEWKSERDADRDLRLEKKKDNDLLRDYLNDQITKRRIRQKRRGDF